MCPALFVFISYYALSLIFCFYYPSGLFSSRGNYYMSSTSETITWEKGHKVLEKSMALAAVNPASKSRCFLQLTAVSISVVIRA